MNDMSVYACPSQQEGKCLTRVELNSARRSKFPYSTIEAPQLLDTYSRNLAKQESLINDNVINKRRNVEYQN